MPDFKNDIYEKGVRLEDKYEQLANKGQPNGYASLDATGKIPANQLPEGTGSGGTGSSTIVVEWFLATSNQTVFTTNLPVSQVIGVYVDGKLASEGSGQSSMEYTISGTSVRTITLGEGLAQGTPVGIMILEGSVA